MATFIQIESVTPDDSARTPIEVRPAVIADIPALADLIRPYVDEGTLLARTLDEFEELLPGFLVAVLHDDADADRIVGCVTLEIYSRKLAEIRSLAVAPEMQGMGIGRLLVEACIERAREQHVFEVMAVTAQDGFFQSLGFDYTLSGVKRALFIQTRDQYASPE
ncbi:MAG: GNAT family N-acetyltransferase [Chloroflexota bacterium]|nr:GNAT family N-acetyltransferase [Chloroflexota bacterium]